LRRQVLRVFTQEGASSIQKREASKAGRSGAGPKRESVRTVHAATRLRLYASTLVRLTLHAPLSRLALAAAILIAVTLGAWSLLGRGPATLAQVQAITQKVPWLYAVVARYQGGGPGSPTQSFALGGLGEVRTERHWYNFAAAQAYAVLDDGGVVGWDYSAGPKKLVYSPRLRTVLVSNLSAPGVGLDSTENLLNVFAVFAARDRVTDSAAEYDGRTVRAFAIEKAESGLTVGDRPVTRLQATILADPRTRRAVAASVEYRGSAGVLAREEWVLSYPASGPGNLYDLGVPATAVVDDRTRRRIGTPGDEPMVVATPRDEGMLPSNRGQDGRDTKVSAHGDFRLAPVEIRLPKPMFAGTPQNVPASNLERPRGRPRPPFLAPVGTTNLALGRPVSSSDPEPVIGSLSAITDGDKEATDGSFVELSPGPQQVTIDLRERCDIYAVVVWHYHRWPRAYRDVVVQVADDPTFRSRVQTIFNNDSDDSLGLGFGKDLDYIETYEGKLMEGKGARGRYVRLYSDGNTHDDLNHYIEVEVYGRPVNR
jgi:hypothetical protein